MLKISITIYKKKYCTSYDIHVRDFALDGWIGYHIMFVFIVRSAIRPLPVFQRLCPVFLKRHQGTPSDGKETRNHER